MHKSDAEVGCQDTKYLSFTISWDKAELDVVSLQHPRVCRVEIISCLRQQITEGFDSVLLIRFLAWIVPTIL